MGRSDCPSRSTRKRSAAAPTFAALKTNAAVVEGMGLSGFGAHSNDAEYVQLNSIVPRLYLTTRMIMDLSTGKLK
jgi:glutamate carboxypeptidase